MRPCPTLTSLHRHDQSRVPSLVRPFDRRQRYYEPLGLPPSTIPFRHRLIGTAFARRGPLGRVSPVPYQAVLTCPPPYPVGVLHPSGSCGCSLLPSSWHERLDHLSLSGFLCHEAARFTFRLGPPTCFPPRSLSASEGLSTSRLNESTLAARPGPATRRTGAYRDGTLTRKSDTARFALQANLQDAPLVDLRRGGAWAPFPEVPVQTGRADFPHPAYRWSSHTACMPPGYKRSRPPAERHSARFGDTAWRSCSC